MDTISQIKPAERQVVPQNEILCRKVKKIQCMLGPLCKEGSKIQMMTPWYSWLDEEVA